MDITLIGELLHYYRKQKKVTLDQLCHGICTKSQLSRIENGLSIPSQMQINTFFTRLGKGIPVGLIPITASERKRFNIQSQIGQLSDARDPRRTVLLKEYKDCSPTWTKLEEQYYLMQEAIHSAQSNSNLKDVLHLFKKALLLTVPNYDKINNFSDLLLSETELILIISIIHTRYFLCEFQHGDNKLKLEYISQLEELKKYCETHIDNYIQTNLYGSILFYLSSWIGLQKDYSKALALAEEGISISLKCNNLANLRYNLFNKGYCLVALGRKSEATDILNHFSNIMKSGMPYDITCQDLPYCLESIKNDFGFEL